MSKTLQNILTALVKIRPIPPRKAHSYEYLVYLLENFAAFDQARETYFHDEAGRNVFDWICQSNLLRTLYGKAEPEVLDNIPYPRQRWQELLQKAEEMTPIVGADYILDRIDTWLLETYSLHGLCEVEPGDIVLDCGAFTGNTSVYFSQKTGDAGHVYGFEPAPVVFDAYRKNTYRYPNITQVHAGLTSKENVRETSSVMRFATTGPGGNFTETGNALAPVTAIDSFCETANLERVDFIKMDVEGSEGEALLGAVNTIRAHRPKMALSAYHRAGDIFELPYIVAAICPGYRFTLRHYSDGACETVLFCRHSDDEYYFGKAQENAHSATSTARLVTRIAALLEPYADPAFVAGLAAYVPPSDPRGGV